MDKNIFGGGNPNSIYVPMSEVEQEAVSRLVESKDLRIVAPETYNGKEAGMSRFLGEAGLTLGENVGVPGATKTAAFFFEDAGAF